MITLVLYGFFKKKDYVMIHRLSLPLQLIIMIALTLMFGNYLSETIVRSIYTMSMFFKEILSFLLPFIIFTFVFTGIISLKKNAPAILAILIGAIFLSNACVALIAYGVSKLILPSLVSTVCLGGGLECVHNLEPFYRLELPQLFRSDYALFLAVILGIVFTFIPIVHVERGIRNFKEALEHFFTYVFIPFLPLYVIGFLLKIHYEGVLVRLIQNYGGAFFLIVVLQLLCLSVVYIIATGFDIKKAIDAMRVAAGSYLTAFSTMSSTATVPVSIKAAIENTGNTSLSQMAMPIMANVHLMGDAISTPILALVTMLLFFGKLPVLGVYVIFAWKFCWSMFAVSGVPAGGIVVMIPVLQFYLGFTPEMIGIMMTLYILLDSFGTAANVMGDGGLVIIVDKIIKKLKLV